MSLVGQRNVYTCDRCHGHIVTVDKDEGTTPFMIQCYASKGCSGSMRSAFYRVTSNVVATHEWRRPTPKEYRKSSEAMKWHFDQGGLDLHPIDTSHAQRNIQEGN